MSAIDDLKQEVKKWKERVEDLERQLKEAKDLQQGEATAKSETKKPRWSSKTW